jgi:hypothetical protein
MHICYINKIEINFDRLISVAMALIIFYVELTWIFWHYPIKSALGSKYDKFQRMGSVFQEDPLPISISVGIIAILLWSKVFDLRTNKTFGPMVQILTKMMTKLMIFGTIYLMVFFICIAAASVAFFDIDEFESIGSSARYLFSSSLGEFDYSIFSSPKLIKSETFGYLFLTFYLIITNVILLNFLIAVLSDIYTELKKKSNSLYLKQLIKTKQYIDNDEYYSSLVAAVVPFNFFILPFAPFLIWRKSKKLNKALMYFCYIPVIVVAGAVFIILSFVWLPFAYLILIGKIVLIKDRTEKGCKSLLKQISQLVLIIFLGVFYMISLICVDFYCFMISLFSKTTYVIL